MSKVLRVAYVDFWSTFKPTNNYFTRLLAPEYELVVSDVPQVVFFSVFGKKHRRYRCRKIFFTGENARPNFRACDYALSFDLIERPDHYRLPLYTWYANPAMLIKPARDPAEVLREKTRFCNFVVSNPRCRQRNTFFQMLSKYRRVDSGGRWLNNIGGPVANKRAMVRESKFTIAFENSSYPGYTTEKIVQPMLEWSAPIYWGNPRVDLDFNPRSFVNAHDYGSLQDVVDRVVELDRDDAKYCEMMAQPWLPGNRVNEQVAPESVRAFLERALDLDIAPPRVAPSVPSWRRMMRFLSRAAV